MTFVKLIQQVLDVPNLPRGQLHTRLGWSFRTYRCSLSVILTVSCNREQVYNLAVTHMATTRRRCLGNLTMVSVHTDSVLLLFLKHHLYPCNKSPEWLHD
jgi:hypothetical protein